MCYKIELSNLWSFRGHCRTIDVESMDNSDNKISIDIDQPVHQIYLEQVFLQQGKCFHQLIKNLMLFYIYKYKIDHS